ncbi:hypothetical protein GO986_21525 [Deinococcus sp. HMF7620]|uniref:Uncharacterized protein n=1 Tax=Deinococcus arboris TaxID=2682977 RepID=A0A7C9LXN4_9DEIO|nr:hypothetical protein [Deinococcus arboris]MVN89320.1 hypothetical protein [Deinococcus arboris]
MSVSILLSSCGLQSNPSTPSTPAHHTSVSGYVYITPNDALKNTAIDIRSLDGRTLIKTESDDEGFFDIDLDIASNKEPFVIVANGELDSKKIQLSRTVNSDDFLDTLDVNLITTLATERYQQTQGNLDLAFAQVSEDLGLKTPGRELRDDSYFVDLSELNISQFEGLSSLKNLSQYIKTTQNRFNNEIKVQGIPSRTYRKVLGSALIAGVGAIADLGEQSGLVKAAKPFLEEYLDKKLNTSSPTLDLNDIVSEIAKLEYNLSSTTVSSTLANELRQLSPQEDLFKSLLRNDIERDQRLKGQNNPQLRQRIEAEEDADAIIQNHSSLQAILFNQSNGLDGQNQKLILDYSRALKPFGTNENASDVGRRRVTAPRGLIETFLAERILENGDDYFHFSFSKGSLLNNGEYYTNVQALKNRYLIMDESDAIEATNLFRNYISHQAYLISRSINLLRKITGYKNKDRQYLDYFSGLKDLEKRRLEAAMSQFPNLTQDNISSFADSTILTFETEVQRYQSVFSYFVNSPYRISIDTGNVSETRSIVMKFKKYFPANVISDANGIVTEGYFVQDGTSGTQQKTFPTIVIDSQAKKVDLWACARAGYIPKNQYESNLFDYPADAPTNKQPTTLYASPALGSVSTEGWRRPDAKVVSKIDATYEVNPLVSLNLIQQMCNFNLLSEGDTTKTAVLLSGASTYKGSFVETKNGRPGVLKINQDIVSSGLPSVLDAHISAPEAYDSYDATRKIYKVGFSSKYNVILPLYLSNYDVIPFIEK